MKDPTIKELAANIIIMLAVCPQDDASELLLTLLEDFWLNGYDAAKRGASRDPTLDHNFRQMRSHTDEDKMARW